MELSALALPPFSGENALSLCGENALSLCGENALSFWGDNDILPSRNWWLAGDMVECGPAVLRFDLIILESGA